MIEFSKYQAAGNDFIIVDDMEGMIDLTPEQVRLLCDRHFGIGADGLILARPSSEADAYMHFYNPDGSLAEMCGNGIRCFARFLYDNSIVEKTLMKIDSLAGVKEVELFFDKDGAVTVEVALGRVSFLAREIPTLLVPPNEEVIGAELKAADQTFKVTCVNVGNPHCVIFVKDVDEIDLEKIGPAIENHDAFPKKTNVEFVQVLSTGHIKVRVWERGAGITLACGTGAVASAAAACRNGFCAATMKVDLPGGRLYVSFDEDFNVILKGGAEHVFNGFLSNEFTERYLSEFDFE